MRAQKQIYLFFRTYYSHIQESGNSANLRIELVKSFYTIKRIYILRVEGFWSVYGLQQADIDILGVLTVGWSQNRYF
jgi:hypothetical protein